ncbi:hypothetical protein [Acidihalobacter prosperus]|uniref:hypothetical protein n=1 Tax=Acidihalobacter prosperus TaxID=160660 RepID=UPI0011AB435F|nr:hypothetical protein [Acidihalobacter prosperus]
MKPLLVISLLVASVLSSATWATAADTRLSGFAPLSESHLAEVYGKGLPTAGPSVRIRVRTRVRLWDSSNTRPQSGNINLRSGLGNTQATKLNVLVPVVR